MWIMEKRKKERKHYGSCGNCSQSAVVCFGSTEKPGLIGKHTNNYGKKANMRSCSNMKQNINLNKLEYKKKLYKYFSIFMSARENKAQELL